MNRFYQLLCASMLAIIFFNSHGQLASSDFPAQQTSDNTKNIAEYLLHMGAYFGYNLKQKPGDHDLRVNAKLLDINKALLENNYALNTLLGAIPLGAANQKLAKIVPSAQSEIEWLNKYINKVFVPNYNQPAVKQGKISADPLIDQKTYQPDPVSQSILNFLATPSDSFCMTQSGKNLDKHCDLLYQSLVSKNVIGEIPSTKEFFNFKYLQPVLPQLNGNTLIGPLLYNTRDPQQGGTGSPVPQKDKPGLGAKNQAQEAANFIRYATGLVVPLKLPSRQAYDNLYLQLEPGERNDLGNNPTEEQVRARATLTNYLGDLRSYTARMSVAISNLYYIFAKRMPQKQDSQGKRQQSQALTEFTMATHRLYNLDMSENKQWLNEINQASPATVQKEIALMLAEMNYQLYLNRQQQERILMTESMMLMLSARMNKPDNSLSTE